MAAFRSPAAVGQNSGLRASGACVARRDVVGPVDSARLQGMAEVFRPALARQMLMYADARAVLLRTKSDRRSSGEHPG